MGGDGVELGCHGHYARNCGTEDGEDGAFAGGHCLKRGSREVLNQVGI